MRIRLATQDDWPALVKLVGHFWDEQERRFGLPRLEHGTLALLRHGIETGQAVVVAEQNLELVGWCARVMAPGLPDGLAVGVGRWVFEPFRREHVGRDLCRFADQHAARCGATEITGEVAGTNEAALAAALADGWAVVGYSIRKPLKQQRPGRIAEALCGDDVALRRGCVEPTMNDRETPVNGVEP